MYDINAELCSTLHQTKVIKPVTQKQNVLNM